MRTKLRGGFLVVLLVCGVPGFSWGQLGWGVMAGLQLTNIDSDLPSSAQQGFQGGLFGEVDAILVGARAEAVLSTKGAEVRLDLEDPANGPVTILSQVDLLYLDLLIMFNVSPNPAIELYVGPLFSFKLNDKIESRSRWAA